MAVSTRTKTVTYARALFLQMNIMTALKNALGNQYIDEEYAEKIKKALKNQWVDRFTIYGEKNGVTVCEFILSIDWATHKVELKQNANIKHNPNWESDGTLNEITSFVHIFQEIVQEKNLKKGLVMKITDGVDSKMVFKTLNWVVAEPRKKAKGLEMGYNDCNPALKELNIQLKIDDSI